MKMRLVILTLSVLLAAITAVIGKLEFKEVFEFKDIVYLTILYTLYINTAPRG